MSTNRIPFSTYLDADDMAKLRERAKAADRSLAAEARRAIRQYLNDPSEAAVDSVTWYGVEPGPLPGPDGWLLK